VSVYLDKVGRQVAPNPLTLNVGTGKQQASSTKKPEDSEASSKSATMSTKATDYSNRSSLREAISALKFAPGDGYGSTVVESVSNSDGVVLSTEWGAGFPSLFSSLSKVFSTGVEKVQEKVQGIPFKLAVSVADEREPPALEVKCVCVLIVRARSSFRPFITNM
jgi:hypothetical protein